jgi:hypothetical protein
MAGTVAERGRLLPDGGVKRYGPRVVAQEFDHGTRWGVAIEFSRGDQLRRNAVRAPQGCMDRLEAITACMPILMEWARSANGPASNK